jgi:multiple sugar transport system substrate-binding protein
MTTTSSRTTRTRLLLTVAAAASALALAACSSTSSTSSTSSATTGKVTLTFWTWVPGISQSVNIWNKSHPDIQVNVDETTSGVAGTYAKMYSALQAGNAPDLGQIEYATLPNFEHVAGLVNLVPFGADKIKPDFVPWTWGQVSQGSGIYAIPQDTGPMGLFYRADLFKKYGLTVPTTWAQFLTDAKKVHAAHPNVYLADFPSNDPQWFSGLAWQAGARWFGTSGDTWLTGIDDSASQQVASFWQQLISDHLVKIDVDFTTQW